MRIRGIAAPIEGERPIYSIGLQGAIAEALGFGLECARGEREALLPNPPRVARQARRAARDGIGLDMVLRCFAAGMRSLEEFIVAEAEGVPLQVLCEILGEQGSLSDRLMKAVAVEYHDELERSRLSPGQRKAEHVVRLLKSGGVVDPVDLSYDFDGWHVGLIFLGHGADPAARSIGEGLGHASLHVSRDEETAWVWLGGVERFSVADLEGPLLERTPSSLSIAIGEPWKGLDGWRLTHREAQIALRVMPHRPRRITRCRDVILISAAIRDQSLATSLVDTYLTRLDGRGDSGEVLRSTLRAYFKANQNIAAAASGLGVARQTVERRLRSVEEKLDQTLDACNAQLQVALGVEELANSSPRLQGFSGV